MKKNHLIIGFFLAIIFLSCQKKAEVADYQIVPLPKEINLTNQKPFILNKSTAITYPKMFGELQKEADFLADYIEDIIGFRPIVKCTDNFMINAINLKINKNEFDNPEAYQIIVSEKNINITSSNSSGIIRLYLAQ